MVVKLLCVSVKVVVPSGRDAQLLQRRPLCAQRQQSRRVFSHLYSVGIAVELLQVLGALAVGRAVLQAHARLEFILCCKVKVARLIVNTDYRRDAPSGLVAVKRYVLCGRAERTQHHGLHLIVLCQLCIFGCVSHVACLLIHVGHLCVCAHSHGSLCRKVLERLGRAYHLAVYVGLDVLHVAVIVRVAI